MSSQSSTYANMDNELVNDTICVSDISVNLTTDEEAARKWLWGSTDELVITIIIPLVVSAGVLGNLIFLYTVLRLPRMHTITNLYLCHLAIADISFMVVSSGSYIWVFVNSPIHHDLPFTSSVGCCLLFGNIVLCYFASVEIVTLVSLERYYAICKPMQHRAIQGMGRTKRLLAVVWFSALVLAILTTPRWGLLKKVCLYWPTTEEFNHLNPYYKDCFIVSPTFFYYPEIIQDMVFMVSFIASVFSYTGILTTLNNRSVIGDGEKENTSGQTQQIRNQVAQMLIITGFVFFVCQAPYRAASVLIIISKQNGDVIFNKDGIGGIVLLISRGLLFLNSAINPFLYALSSSFYRNAFREALFGKPAIMLSKH